VGNSSIKGKHILDAGCGDGVLIRRCKERGARIVGIDISPDSIEACKKEDKSGNYFVMDVKNIQLKQKFDYVLSSFILLSFDKEAEIVKAIKSMANVLDKRGKLIIALPHPAFEDMQNANSMVKSFPDKYSYAKKGLKVIWTKKEGNMSFTDFHWMIEDYVGFIKNAGLVIEDIKEPIPVLELKKENPKFYESARNWPGMILFICKK
jgi:ubiquinone/menaquinone biosynthesis C-methylase UbiE